MDNWTSVTTNGTTQTRTANAQNQYTSISGGSTPSYDKNGDLTTDPTDGNTYVYDAWNRLVAVENGSTTLASYGYDALDRRITETSTATLDLYFSKDWQVVEEQAGGVMQTQYVWSPVYVDAMVERDTSNGTRLYAQQDANWNVTAVVDVSGTVQEAYIYDPYGAVTFLAPDWSSGGRSSVAWIYLHQGGRYDNTSRLYSFRHRDYSPALGRWTEQDPLFEHQLAGRNLRIASGQNNSGTNYSELSSGRLARSHSSEFPVGGANLYEYVGANPIIGVDPSGLLVVSQSTLGLPAVPWIFRFCTTSPEGAFVCTLQQ